MKEAHLCVECVEGNVEDRIWWGDIHGHTEMSDGLFSIDDYYLFGRDGALLDFCATADHAWELLCHHRNRIKGGGWKEVLRAARQPGPSS